MIPGGKNAEVGEAVTGFEKADHKGPFECGNCTHMENGYCHHPVMMAKSKEPKNKSGFVQVDEHDCCKFVRRVGKYRRIK